MTEKLTWEELTDDNGNTYFEADGPFSDDGVAFRWRLRKRLRNDRTEWYADHDSELMVYVNTPVYSWRVDAKGDTERLHNEILESERQAAQTKIEVTLGRKLFEFRDLDEWTHKAREWHDRNGANIYKAVRIDAVGRVCTTGLHLERADIEDTFPVTVYAIDADVKGT